MPVPYVWLAYYDPPGLTRRYWHTDGTRSGWRSHREGAARFPDMHAARLAVSRTAAGRRCLARIGYELLPPTVEQLQLQIEGEQP